jgi:F-box and leucine-rich repeat protein GRR1
MAHIDFDHGHLNLANAFSSLTLENAVFQRFGSSLVSLNWIVGGPDVLDGDLVHLMSTCSQLQHFEIRCAQKVTDEGLIRALSSLPHLTSISLLKCTKLTVKGVQKLIKRCRHLRHIKLWGIGWCGNDALDEDRSLSLSSMSSDALAHERSVEAIDWDATKVSDDDLYLITSMCSKLKHFELGRAPNVTDEGLIRALSPLPHLTSISLSHCQKLTVAGLVQLAERCRLVRHFTIGKKYNQYHRNCKNQFEFDEGKISGCGDLYWPLAEMFSCR